MKAFVEASLPLRVHGNNLSPLPWTDCPGAIDDLLRDVNTLLRFQPSDAQPCRLEMRRVDLTSDFEAVPNIPALLDGLAYVPRSGLFRHVDRHGGVGGRTKTLVVGTRRSARFKLYDKHAETRGLAPVGLLRFEATLRSERLTGAWARNNGGNIMVLADVTEAKVECLARASFDLAAFGSPVLARGEVVRRAMQVPGLKDRERGNFLAVIVADAEGVNLPLDPKTTRKYRRLARRHGLVMARDEAPALMQLDWITGYSEHPTS